jgi:hypothetical protein
VTRRTATLPTAAALLFAVASPMSAPAFACACCSNEGQRTDTTEALDAFVANVLSEIRFDGKAQLYVGEGEPDDDWALQGPSEFDLAVTKNATSWSLAFAQKDVGQGNAQKGVLTFTLPKTVTRFEVDPRDPAATSQGLGPVLYKEWRLSAPWQGTGMFEAAGGGDQQAALILHGRGLSCTEASHFNAWTLLLSSAKVEASFYGSLDPEPGDAQGGAKDSASEAAPPAAP